MASKPSSRTRIFGKDDKNIDSEDLKLQPSESSRFNSSAFTFFIPIEHHGMNVAAIRDKNREAWGNATNFLLSSKARGFPLWKKFEEQIRSKGSTILGKPHIPTVLQHISFDFDVENEDLFDVPVESTILVQLPFQPTLLFQWLTCLMHHVWTFEHCMSAFYHLPVPKKFKPHLLSLHELLKTTHRNIGFLFDYLQFQINSETEIFVGNLKIFDMIVKELMPFIAFWFDDNGPDHLNHLKMECWQNWKSDVKHFQLRKEIMPLKNRNFLFNPDFCQDLKLFGNSNESLFSQQSLTHDENGEGFSHQHKMKKYLTERFSSEAIEKLDLDVLKKDQDFSNVICKAKNAEQLWQMTQIKNKDRQGVFGDALVINALNDYEDALMVVASWIVNKFKLSPKHFGIKGLTSNCKLDSDYLLQVIKNSKGVTFSLQGVLQSIWKLDFTLEKSKQNTIFEQFGKKFETRIRDIVLKCIETHLKIENFEEEKDEVLRDWQVVQYLLPCFVASYLDWCETVPQIDLRDRKRYEKFIDELIKTYEKKDGIRKSSWLNVMKDVDSITALRESHYENSNKELLSSFDEVSSIMQQIIFCPDLKMLYEDLINNTKESTSCTYWKWLMWDFFSRLNHAFLLSNL
ncbi:Hypothetical predicted protein [Cloeon dipterum]|uniref:Uncharacterized protein n=1 Tax=Cloeon dipterum TaxID=197152 RepID=A0A8S1DY54_9INSE|nr:Hypothetical predicted protein [Cloeon dipterum]